MQRSRRQSAALLILCSLLGAGCVSAPPEGSLAALEAKAARDLAVACYRNHSDAIPLYGSGAPIWSACQAWAQQAVKRRMPTLARPGSRDDRDVLAAAKERDQR